MNMRRMPCRFLFVADPPSWRLIGVGFLCGAALATALTTLALWTVLSPSAQRERGYWQAQRDSRDWCAPHGVGQSFPIIKQRTLTTADDVIDASSILSGGVDAVKRVRLSSPAQFESDLLARDAPAVVEGLTDDWPEWLGDTRAEGKMAQLAGDVGVRVETSGTGRFGHVEPTWSDTHMTLKEFFARGHCAVAGGTQHRTKTAGEDGDGVHTLGMADATDAPVRGKGENEDEPPPDAEQGEGDVPRGDAHAGSSDKGRHKYLSFNLEEHMLRELSIDKWPVPCLSKGGIFSPVVREALMWIGSGTDSTLHNDSWENLFCVTAGRKDVVLLDPAQGGLVGERVGFDRVSMVLDPVNEAEKYYETLTRQLEEQQKHAPHRVQAEMHARGLPTGPIKPLTVSVNAGECLYIPSYWYHQIKSPPGICTAALTLWLDLLRVTSRVSVWDRVHVSSYEIKQRLLRGGIPVKCAKTQRPGEDPDDDQPVSFS